ERLRVEGERLEEAGARVLVGLDPVRDLVPLALEDGVRAERVAGAVRVARVLDPLAAAVAMELVLVFYTRPVRNIEREVPDVRGRDARERALRLEAEDPVTEGHAVGLAAPHEGGVRALDDGERAPLLGEERVDL